MHMAILALSGTERAAVSHGPLHLCVLLSLRPYLRFSTLAFRQHFNANGSPSNAATGKQSRSDRDVGLRT